ncbi:MAG TPA: twin-arginine translocase subunit TatC, partial [Gemmatales bacterium]|nr:twin-arginine translocase subunit TatC [Gemmatales bacterium]
MARANRNLPAHDDDYFADSRMSFGEHIEVLRRHLFRAIYGLVLGVIVAFFLAKDVMAVITQPVEEAVKAYEMERLQSQKKNLADAPSHPLHESIPVEVVLQPADLAATLKTLDPQFFAGLRPVPTDAAPLRHVAKLADPVRVAADLQSI